jgi:hypothetical protein
MRGNARFPIERTASGQRVVFFDDFFVQLHLIAKAGDSPTEIELETRENGRIFLRAGTLPVNVTYNGINYFLSAKESSNGQPPTLELNR